MKSFLQIIGFCALILILKSHKTSGTCDSTCRTTLRKDLLSNYDTLVRPTNVTKLKVSITVMHVEINECANSFTVNGWTKMDWTDERLKWNESDYGGQKELRVMMHEIWTPDLEVYNTALSAEGNHFGAVRCIVYSSGMVLCVPPSKLTSVCDLNFKYWPFDYQKCMVKIGSWTYSNFDVDLQIDKSEIMLLTENSRWKIVKFDSARNLKYYPCCPEPYPDIEFNFTLHRVSDIQKTITLAPIPIVVISTLGAFWLPVQSCEKVIVNIFNILILTLFMKYCGEFIPFAANQTPLIVNCYVTLIYSVLASMVINVIVVSLAKKCKGSNVPSWLKNFCVSWYASLLGLKQHKQSQESKLDELKHPSLEETSQTEDVHHVNHQWILLGKIVNRSAFIVFAIFYFVITFDYLF